MIKMVILLERREDMTHEEFAEYWREEHAPLVEEMPHVRRYVVDLPTDPERSAYDGIAELVFEDMDTLSAAFDSEAGQAVDDDGDNFIDDETVMFVEESVQFER